MLHSKSKVGVIGAGVMGRAIIAGALRSGIAPWAAVRSQSSKLAAEAELGICVTTNFQQELADTSVLVLATKPRDILQVCNQVGNSEMSPDALIVSVAAGLRTEQIESALGHRFHVLRAMPNTPCRVGAGMTILCRGKGVDDAKVETAKLIFGGLGQSVELDERLMDPATAVSASGPAFAFLIFEAFVDAGVRAGLPRTIATELVLQCFSGSVEMMRKTGKHTAVLRDEVTTPGGCTINGLMQFELGNLRAVVNQAIEVTAEVAAQLGRPIAK
jgi:pyrroline-5-carboxylate reductase